MFVVEIQIVKMFFARELVSMAESFKELFHKTSNIKKEII